MTPALSALSVRQPWAGLICGGTKRYETRSWRTHRRGWIAIHASKRPTGDWPSGCIVAVARLAACGRVEDIHDQLSAREREAGDYTDGRFAWRLEDVRVLKTPIPHAGGLSFWPVDPSVARAIDRELDLERS